MPIEFKCFPFDASSSKEKKKRKKEKEKVDKKYSFMNVTKRLWLWQTHIFGGRTNF